MTNLAIRAEALGTRYELGARPGVNTLREALMMRLRGPRRSPPPSIWALRDVDFEIRWGETVGLISSRRTVALSRRQGSRTLVRSPVTDPTNGCADYYRRMSVFVAPVHRESFGQVSVFAMAMAIPVVGYDVGALAEIVGDPELLAPARDAERLADIIASLLDDRERRQRIGAANRRRAEERFSVHAMIESFAGLYAAAVPSGLLHDDAGVSTVGPMPGGR
jgi:glycosyltransferase involved in cell wall biosynthesis